MLNNLDRTELYILDLQMRFLSPLIACVDSVVDVKFFLRNRERQFLCPPRAAQILVTLLSQGNTLV